jgi:hypothetical protein
MQGTAKWLALAIVGLVPAAASGRAEIGRGLDVAVGAAFAFGGELHIDWETAAGDGEWEDNLDPSVGFGVWLDTGVHRFVNIGGEFRVQWWTTDDADDHNLDRSALLDFNFSLRVGGEVVRGLTLYGRVPLGLTLGVPSDDLYDAGYRLAAGLDWGILFGLGYDFNDWFGVFLETGYVHHMAWGEYHLGAGEFDASYSMPQFGLHLGVTF